MEKLDGVENPQYGTKVLNFNLALSASGDKKACEYVSGNLVGVRLCHMQSIMARLHTSTFIYLNKEEMKSCLSLQGLMLLR